jgi:hypothetical protein
MVVARGASQGDQAAVIATGPVPVLQAGTAHGCTDRFQICTIDGKVDIGR